MATISAGDITKLRYPYIRRKNTTLNISELEEIASAEIDTFTATYPRATYPVTNVSSNWENISPGKYVTITSPAGVRKFDGILRLGNTLTELRIAGHVQGDTGLAKETAVSIAQGDLVKVYRQQIPQSFLSRVDEDGVLYKRWSRAFDTGDPQTNRPKPQVNIGTDMQYTVAAGGTQTGVPLDASNSFSYIGNSVSYEWIIPTGVTITSGVDTDASITVSIDEGQYAITCRVTDDGTGEQTRGFRWYYVNSPDAPAFSDEYNVVGINGFKLTRRGWEATFTVSASYEGMPTERLYTGAPVLLTYDIEYSADGKTWVTTDDEALNRRSFKGYIHSFNDVSYTANGRVESVSFVVKSSLLYLYDVPVASQAIQYSASPANWQQSSYTDIPNLFAIVGRYHNDIVVEDQDVYPYTDMTLETPLHAVNQGSMAAALVEIAEKRLGGTIGNISNGQMYMKAHRSYEDDAFRTAQTSRFTFTDADVTADSVRYTLNEIMKYWLTQGGFFVEGTTGRAIVGIRGLGAPMQGVSYNQTRGFVAETQSDGLARIGHDHQNKNRRFEILTLNSYNDGVVDPALMDAYTMSLDALDALDKGVWNNIVYIPVEVRYNFGQTLNASVPPLLEIDFEPETKGLPATKVVAKPVAASTYTFDFTLSDGGFTDTFGVYTGSVGWVSEFAFSNERINLDFNFAGFTTIIKAVAYVTADSTMTFPFSFNSGMTLFDGGTPVSTGTVTQEWTGLDGVLTLPGAQISAAADNISVDLSHPTIGFTLTRIVFTFTGANNII